MTEQTEKKRRACPRPSILDHVTLSDGRLAWPVAQAAGMSEVVFRGRLKKGMSADAALAMPYQPQDREKVAARRQARREDLQACEAARRERRAAARKLAAARKRAAGLVKAADTLPDNPASSLQVQIVKLIS